MRIVLGSSLKGMLLMKRKCIFFDRDGIVNKSPGPGYVERWEDFDLQSQFVEVLRIVSELGYVAVVVTNQSCVARGIVSIDTLNDMHARLNRVLKDEHGLSLLDIVMCPHDNNECSCRKPRPGMFQESARKHNIDLASSWMIGDDERDVLAGKAAGCRTIRVVQDDIETVADFRVSNMDVLRDRIVEILNM